MVDWKYRVDRGHDGVLDFTPRQLEVLALVANGMAIKQVARELHISAGTVKDYLNGVSSRFTSKKLRKGVYGIVEDKGRKRGRAAAVVYAIAVGILVERPTDQEA